MKRSNLFIILVLIAIIVVSLQSLIQYRQNSRMQKSLKKMEVQLESASHDLTQARGRMELLKLELSKLQNFIDSSEIHVNKLNNTKAGTTVVYLAERKRILRKLEELYISIDSTRNSLPEIKMEE